MQSNLPKGVAVMAGVILVAGVLLIGAQYFAQLSGGVSADVAEQELPEVITVNREDYRTALRLLAEYETKTDLARKNLIFKELSSLIVGWKGSSTAF